MATRVEGILLGKNVNISVGDESFELFPTKKTAIESSVLLNTFRKQSAGTFNVVQSDSLPQSREITSLDKSEINGHKCWKLSRKFSHEFLDRLPESVALVS